MTIVESVIDLDSMLVPEHSEHFEGYRGEYRHDKLVDLANYFLSGHESRGLDEEFGGAIVICDVEDESKKTISFILPGPRTEEAVARRSILSLTETPQGAILGDNTSVVISLTSFRSKMEDFRAFELSDHYELDMVRLGLESWLLDGRKDQVRPA